MASSLYRPIRDWGVVASSVYTIYENQRGIGVRIEPYVVDFDARRGQKKNWTSNVASDTLLCCHSTQVTGNDTGSSRCGLRFTHIT